MDNCCRYVTLLVVPWKVVNPLVVNNAYVHQNLYLCMVKLLNVTEHVSVYSVADGKIGEAKPHYNWKTYKYDDVLQKLK